MVVGVEDVAGLVAGRLFVAAFEEVCTEPNKDDGGVVDAGFDSLAVLILGLVATGLEFATVVEVVGVVVAVAALN